MSGMKILSEEEKQEHEKKYTTVEEENSKPEFSTEPKNNDLGIKYYTVDLPSNGVLGYPKTVKYRDILVRDEKILSASPVSQYSKTINNILKSLLGDIDWYGDLSIHDRDYLLIWVWANNYSSVKNVEVECDNVECGHKNHVQIDLTKLQVTPISKTIKSPFVIDRDRNITVRMATVNDQLQAENFIERHPEYDYDTVFYSLTVDIGKVLPIDRKINWIEENLSGKTMGMVRAYHEHYKYGIEDMLEMTCEACKEVTPYRLPFRPEWLRPTLQDDFEKMLRFNEEV